ncbi:DMT family transporter [Chloroflexota bacterium]
MDDTAIGVLLAVLAAILWGVGNTIARVGLQSIKATSASILSLSAGLVVVWITALVFEFDTLVSVSLVAIGWFALTGVLHLALGRFLLYQTMRYIGAARGTSVAHSYPIFALIFAIILLKETPTIPVVIGTVSIVGGIYLLLTESSETSAIKKSRMLGYSVGLVAALLWGAVSILIKHVSQFGPSFVVLSFALLFGTLALSAATGKSFQIGVKANKKAIYLLLLSGFLNGIGLIGFYSALAKAPVVVVSPLVATSPLFTVLCVHLFLQRLERITIHVLLGCLLVVAGGVLVAIY